MSKRTFIGAGKVYMQQVGGTGGLLHIGLVDKLELLPASEKKELRDATQGGGGVYDSVERISGIGVSMTIRDLSASNLAVALYGIASAVTAGTVDDEVHVANSGALIVLNNQPDLEATVTVEPSGGGTAYIENTDYTLTGAGIVIIAGGGITDGSSVQISYTKLAGSVVQAFVESGKEYRLFFEGLNDADSGKPVHVDLFKFKPTPTSTLGLITEDFAELPLEGSLLQDSSKTGLGISKYCTIKAAN